MSTQKGCLYLNTSSCTNKLNEVDAKKIIKSILEGVDYLHKNGIAHRDLKLENIIINKSKDIKIIDFGFATKTKPNQKGKTFCGTPSYMAPEIINHIPHNYMKADIWAVGIIFFALLSGRFPFKGRNDKDLYNKIRKGAFTMPQGITLEAKSMLLSMLQVDPHFRKHTFNPFKDLVLDGTRKSVELSKETKTKHKILSSQDFPHLDKNRRSNIIEKLRMKDKCFK